MCIDHSLLRPELTREEVEAGLAVAAEHRSATVCVRPADLGLAVERLRGTRVGPTTVVGFPSGAHLTRIKVAEAEVAAYEGAIELDMVLAIGALRSDLDAEVGQDIAAVVEAVDPMPVKVILETAYLSPSEVVRGCRLAADAGAAFVQNGTGFSQRGADAEEIALMRRTVGDEVGVKATGGIRSLDTALAIIGAGANRFGATATARIAREWHER
ncbi:MAG: deoxyribose-phosphate aldolase [Nitriliruptorales bacterium]|nr:deoxyribose-phosphate aldolase [Nitriliruptorales bacterium]